MCYSHFHLTNFFDIFQDDFLDLADDNSNHHHAEMALCMSPSSHSNSTTITDPKSNQISSEADLQNVNQLVNDNPVMKLDNLDSSWDQDV